MSENSDIFTNISKYDYGTYRKNNELNKKHEYINHIVQENDTLTSIAIKYNVSSGTLKQFNNMFTNEIAFMKIIKIPILKNCNAKALCIDETQHLDKPDLIKDYIKPSCSQNESIEIQTNNSFLDKMDQEILKAKSNLNKLNQRNLLKDLEYGVLSQSNSTSYLPSLNQNNISSQSKQVDVHIKMPQEHFQNTRYPYYNPTFKDNFYDL